MRGVACVELWLAACEVMSLSAGLQKVLTRLHGWHHGYAHESGTSIASTQHGMASARCAFLACLAIAQGPPFGLLILIAGLVVSSRAAPVL